MMEESADELVLTSLFRREMLEINYPTKSIIKRLTSLSMSLLHNAQKDQIIDIRSGGTGFQQIAKRAEKRIRIILG